MDLQRAAQKSDPFAHAYQAQTRRFDPQRVETRSIVDDLE